VARILVVAGTASGVGKTTITLGLLEAFRRRGLVVQAFKVGPDFIDPGFHELVSGRPSYSLDGWMCGRDHVRATVARHAADVDLVLVEGVMGCFDGADPTSDDGSTAQVAKWLHAPVVLVIDASAQARSSAAVVRGFESFDPDLGVAAIIANRLGGEAHARLIREAMRGSCRAELVGGIPRDPALELPERHLGLVTAIEGVLTGERRERLATTIERSVDLDRLLAIASPLPSGGVAAPIEGALRASIGVAHDAAFQFYYEENLDLLRAAGAELVAWSPVADPDVPDVEGLYLGGGYPELHGAALGDNASLKKSVRRFAEAGRPIYAECGGLMYLGRSLRTDAGTTHRMAGVIPVDVEMDGQIHRFGYRQLLTLEDSILSPRGQFYRGHEFHWSRITGHNGGLKPAYQMQNAEGDVIGYEGFVAPNLLASYVHLHFGQNPLLVDKFVQHCREHTAIRTPS